MKAIITIAIDNSVEFKFAWAEKGSFVSHVGEIIKEENRTKRGGAVRMSASRKWTDKKDGKNHYEERVLVPSWIKDAIDYAFVSNKDKLGKGVKFSVTCFMSGQKPLIEGLTELVDTSWKVAFDSGKAKATKATDDSSADAAAAEVLG